MTTYVLKMAGGQEVAQSASPIASTGQVYRSATQVWLDPAPGDGSYVETVHGNDALPVPASVTAAQAIIALDALKGITEADVLAVIEAAIPDGPARRQAIAWFTRSNEFMRTHALLNSMAPALGLSQADLDDLFRYAATVKG